MVGPPSHSLENEAQLQSRSTSRVILQLTFRPASHQRRRPRDLEQQGEVAFAVLRKVLGGVQSAG